MDKYCEIVVRFQDAYNNLLKSELKSNLDREIMYEIRCYLENFEKFSKVRLNDYINTMYEKTGIAFLDHKGRIGVYKIVLIFN